MGIALHALGSCLRVKPARHHACNCVALRDSFLLANRPALRISHRPRWLLPPPTLPACRRSLSPSQGRQRHRSSERGRRDRTRSRTRSRSPRSAPQRSGRRSRSRSPPREPSRGPGVSGPRRDRSREGRPRGDSRRRSRSPAERRRSRSVRRSRSPAVRPRSPPRRAPLPPPSRDGCVPALLATAGRMHGGPPLTALCLISSGCAALCVLLYPCSCICLSSPCCSLHCAAGGGAI